MVSEVGGGFTGDRRSKTGADEGNRTDIPPLCLLLHRMPKGRLILIVQIGGKYSDATMPGLQNTLLTLRLSLIIPYGTRIAMIGLSLEQSLFTGTSSR
ncbi:hypothetical protein SDC9_106530 [bioreactor metagenome]|uniref:Uncharacterized protein n=1 Tax=bioreactor metagenome TaxID=1076179 RepID=A0A645BDA9_9ZZZZ